MKLNKSILYISIVAFLLIQLLLYRYFILGYDSFFLRTSFSFFLIALFFLLFSGVKYSNLINPISAYAIFLFLFSYSVIPLSKDQSLYTINIYLVIFLSLFFYICPFFLNIKLPTIRFFCLSIKSRVHLLNMLVCIAFVVFILECIRFGFIPILNISSMDVYIESNDKLIPFLHYFIVLIAFVPTWSYLFYKEKIVTRKHMLVLMFFSFLILVNYLSRQVYLLLGILFFISYSRYHKVNIVGILRACLGVGLIFVFVGYLKFNSDLTDSFSEFMRLIAGVENEKVNVLESTVVEYSSKRYTALNDIVNERDNLDYYGLGIYTFRPFLSLLLFEKMGFVVRQPSLDSEVLVTTYAADPYLDFGFLGVIVLNFIYGCIAMDSYKKYEKGSLASIVVWGAILFCIVMSMFINYYNTMLIWLGLFFNALLLYKIK